MEFISMKINLVELLIKKYKYYGKNDERVKEIISQNPSLLSMCPHRIWAKKYKTIMSLGVNFD